MLPVVGVQRQQVVYLLYYISISNTQLFDNQLYIFLQIPVFPPFLHITKQFWKPYRTLFSLGDYFSIIPLFHLKSISNTLFLDIFFNPLIHPPYTYLYTVKF